MGDQSVAVHQKLVTLSFATENGMVVEYEAGLARSRLALENQCGRQAADAAAHDHAVVSFAVIDQVRGKTLEHSVTNLMSGLQDCGGIAVGIRIVADAT